MNSEIRNAALAALVAGGGLVGCDKPNPQDEQRRAAAVKLYEAEVQKEVCQSSVGPECDMAVGTRELSNGMSGKDTVRIKQIEYCLAHPDTPKDSPKNCPPSAH